MRFYRSLVHVACLLVLSACSGDGGPEGSAGDGSVDHVWKAQENAYNQAQDVAPMLEETEQRRRGLMEEQGG